MWLKIWQTYFFFFFFHISGVTLQNTFQPRHEQTCLRGRDKTRPAQPHRPAWVEILDWESVGFILSRQQTTNSLSGLCGCAGWSALLMFAYGVRQIFSCRGSFSFVFSLFSLFYYCKWRKIHNEFSRKENWIPPIIRNLTLSPAIGYNGSPYQQQVALSNPRRFCNQRDKTTFAHELELPPGWWSFIKLLDVCGILCLVVSCSA